MRLAGVAFFPPAMTFALRSYCCKEEDESGKRELLTPATLVCQPLPRA